MRSTLNGSEEKYLTAQFDEVAAFLQKAITIFSGYCSDTLGYAKIQI